MYNGACLVVRRAVGVTAANGGVANAWLKWRRFLPVRPHVRKGADPGPVSKASIETSMHASAGGRAASASAPARRRPSPPPSVGMLPRRLAPCHAAWSSPTTRRSGDATEVGRDGGSVVCTDPARARAPTLPVPGLALVPRRTAVDPLCCTGGDL